MRFRYKILIGGILCAGLILVVILLDLPPFMVTATIITISIILSMLGLAYYEERQEPAHKKKEPPREAADSHTPEFFIIL